MTTALLLLCLLQDPAKECDALKTEVRKLAIETPWSQVPWKRCLVDAFAKAREEGKPVLMWALGGDPEGRC